jgi:hypothetical protein
MRFSSHLSAFSLLNIYGSLAFPSYGTLAGLSRSELDAILPTLKRGVLESPPGPLQDTSAKLVNDEKHPWKPAGKHDIRGPCPGLNTLASHGVGLPTAGLNKRGSLDVDFCFQQWLPRNGVATPGQIVNAVQEGSLLMSIYYPVADVSDLPILLLLVQASTWETTSPYLLLTPRISWMAILSRTCSASEARRVKLVRTLLHQRLWVGLTRMRCLKETLVQHEV